MTLHSFDIFDTLITRTTATPRGIFGLMQQRLKTEDRYAGIDTYIRENFFQLRIGAEQQARKFYQKNGCEDITLEQIYDVMEMTSCLSQEERCVLLELERETEIHNVRGIRSNIDRALSLKHQGKRVVLISDMYLDVETIRKMLEKAEPELAKLPIYLSSEQKRTKNGSLFMYVALREKASFSDWVHYGDNPWADGNSPEQMGICAKRVPAKELLPFEKEILTYKEENGHLQYMIGAGANARLDREDASQAYRYGTSLGGCIAYSYVWWVVDQTAKKGIRRLYFIARDSFLLKEIADEIILKYGFEIKTSYLYGSRKAWRLAGLSERNCNILLLVRWSVIDRLTNTLRLAEVFDMEEKELLAYLPEGFRKAGTSFTTRQLVKLAGHLEENQGFKKELLRKNHEKRLLTLDYLRQEIDFSDPDFGFVELIGSGYTQRALAGLMEELTELPVRTFFYRLDACLGTSNCIFYNYQPEDIANGGLMELLFTAPHGHTLGYARDERGKVSPVLDHEEKYLLEYGLSDFQDGVRDFVKEYHKAADMDQERGDFLEPAWSYRRYMARCRDQELLAYLGDMPFTARGEDLYPYCYAPKLSEEMIRNIYLIRKNEPLKEFYPGTNFDMSLKRCTTKEQQLIAQYDEMRRKGQAQWSYNFPIDELESRVAIYGAGKFGRALYKKLCEQGERRVVQWVDQNYEKCREMGLAVDPVDMLDEAKFDQVVIAILNLHIAYAVKAELIFRGIPQEKIVLNNFAPEW